MGYAVCVEASPDSDAHSFVVWGLFLFTEREREREGEGEGGREGGREGEAPDQPWVMHTVSETHHVFGALGGGIHVCPDSCVHTDADPPTQTHGPAPDRGWSKVDCQWPMANGQWSKHGQGTWPEMAEVEVTIT